MREIKFRAWDKIRKGMFEVNWWDMQAETMGLGHPEPEYSIEQDDCEVMQYTGLKDKNGKEIYEGDVVEMVEDYEMFNNDDTLRRGVVKFIDGEAEWWVEAIENDSEDFIRITGSAGDGELGAEEVKIIGNIYENPSYTKL